MTFKPPRFELIETGIGKPVRVPVCCGRTSWTYVIETAAWLKIGRTIDLPRRLTEIQSCCPTQLVVLGLGRSDYLETPLHRICAEYRTHGEWFKREAWHEIHALFVSNDQCAACVFESRGLRPWSKPNKVLR